MKLFEIDEIVKKERGQKGYDEMIKKRQEDIKRNKEIYQSTESALKEKKS